MAPTGSSTSAVQDPSGNGVTEIALTLDIEEPNLTSPPVIAMNAPAPASRRAVSASTNRGGWRAIGAAPSPLIPNGTALMLGGIGMGEDRVGRLPVTAWITGSVSYSIDSTRFASADFTNGQLGLIAPTPAWSTYAPSFAVGSPKATSFDPREFRVTCGTDIVPSFGYAISESTGFQVLRGQCNNAPFGLGAGRTASHRRCARGPVIADGGCERSVVAGVQLVGGQYQLSVWRYAP